MFAPQIPLAWMLTATSWMIPENYWKFLPQNTGSGLKVPNQRQRRLASRRAPVKRLKRRR